MRSVEIYKEAEGIISEENDRRVNLQMDPNHEFVLSVAQSFSRDMKLSAWELFRESGFAEIWEGTDGKTRASMGWSHFGISFYVDASLISSETVLLELAWKFEDVDAIHLKGTVRAMNRVFNMMKAKLEAE